MLLGAFLVGRNNIKVVLLVVSTWMTNDMY